MGCGKAPVGVQGIVNSMCRGHFSFSAQWMCPYTTGFAMMASACTRLKVKYPPHLHGPVNHTNIMLPSP